MNSTTAPVGAAPFDFGAHVRYVGERVCQVPAGGAGHEVVLARGMVGVVILSSGTAAHCRVQFKNGFQLDVTPENRADFEPTHPRLLPA